MKYQVIYADPPWHQKGGRPLSGGYKIEGEKQIFNPKNNKSSPLPYKTMALKEICELNIHEKIADNAHLYIWSTNKYLMDVNSVIKEWGFKYSTTLVWTKNAMGGGLGGAFKVTTEFLIFATKGNLKASQFNIGTHFNIKRPYKNGYPCHSRKPDFFYELIERISPGPYLELFAREKREGWDVYGNEVEDSIELTSNS